MKLYQKQFCILRVNNRFLYLDVVGSGGSSPRKSGFASGGTTDVSEGATGSAEGATGLAVGDPGSSDSATGLSEEIGRAHV